MFVCVRNRLHDDVPLADSLKPTAAAAASFISCVNVMSPETADEPLSGVHEANSHQTKADQEVGVNGD